MIQPAAPALAQLRWPASRLDEALRTLCLRTGLVTEPLVLAAPPTLDDEVDAWLHYAAQRFGIETVAVSSPCGEFLDMLRRLGPALLRLPGDAAERYLVVLGTSRFRLQVLDPFGSVHAISPTAIRDAFLADSLSKEQESVRSMLSALGQPLAEQSAGLRAFALDRLSDQQVLGTWLIRPSPASEVRVHARAAHLPFLIVTLVLTHALSSGLMLLSWGLLGRDFLVGEIQRSSLSLWAIGLMSGVPLRLLETWLQSRIALDVSANLKTSLLYGLLRLERSATRGLGIGHFLGMTMEAETASTAMQSDLALLIVLFDLVVALFVLASGAAGHVSVLLFLGWLAFGAWLWRSYAQSTQRFVAIARRVTRDLVERLVGYQTRLMQEDPRTGHPEEDALLLEYLGATQDLDRRRLVNEWVMGPGWMVIGVVYILFSLPADGVIGMSQLLSIGGVALGAAALKKCAARVRKMLSVWVAWQQVAPIWQAGRQGALQDAEAAALPRKPAHELRSESPNLPLLRFDNLTVRYDPDARAVLLGCSQQIHAGDRVLLEGPSGGGKSTLAVVLCGLRRADSGSLALSNRSVDEIQPALWRKQVVLVPQFHDNHLLTESLLFNLLLGRQWPATPKDEAAAAAICELLGLGPLLSRMPQGFAQVVGDGGWALSHGERSRVFLARSLLQDQASLLILDESFAALDPETLRASYRGVLSVHPALLVIAHP